MRRLKRSSFLDRLLRRLTPPRYPEYEEYRGEEPEIDETGRERPAVPLPAPSADETAVKVRRLQVLSFFIAVFSIVGFVYFYLTNDSSIDRRQRSQDLLATEAVKELMPPGEGAREETLDDIKRWSQEIEARVVRDVDRSETAVRPGRSAMAEAIAPILSSPAWTIPSVSPDPAVDRETNSWTDAMPTGEGGTYSTGEAKPWQGPAATPGTRPAPRPPLPERVTVPTSAETESVYSPYRRRDVAPIVIEPRITEPY